MIDQQIKLPSCYNCLECKCNWVIFETVFTLLLNPLIKLKKKTCIEMSQPWTYLIYVLPQVAQEIEFET